MLDPNAPLTPAQVHGLAREWVETSDHPNGFVVVCEDGEVRHAEPFGFRVLARDFAEWGHCCTSRHSIVEVARRATVAPTRFVHLPL